MLLFWLAPALAGTCTGFVGPFGPGEWITSGNPDWSIDAASTTATMTYLVPSAPAPFSVFQVGASVADVDEVQFDWTYDYNHGYFETEAVLDVSTDQGTRVLHEGIGVSFEGSQSASGSETIDVAGDTFGLRVEGDNFDGGTGLSGTVVLSALSFTSDLCDCAGIYEGDAVEDMCGDCDGDPANDCVQDCAGVWGGSATVDACDDCVGGTTGLDPCEPTTGTDPPTDPQTSTDTASEGDPPSTDTTASPTSPAAALLAVDGCGCHSGGRTTGWWFLARRL